MTTGPEVELPPKLVDVFGPERGAVQYRCARRARLWKVVFVREDGAIWGYAEPLRVLCTRELQISIKESFHAS